MSELSVVRENVIEALRNDIATITFTKKDGTERVMKGTLMSTELPVFAEADKSKTTKAPKKVNEEVIACFDVEAQGFRSFRIDSVTSFETPTASSGRLINA
jgi:hypothetical protein